ncbi:multidrug resistance protein [Trichodelitschia bisporula]|uniref:Multidrug resistance protein n=1 Tax=Trichodelitschia bisporula TaxID=703511 RepID=A0A6G1HQD3_9PEZI|nr:multidrug resistance protein [Trichodelitschia bisporula]
MDDKVPADGKVPKVDNPKEEEEFVDVEKSQSDVDEPISRPGTDGYDSNIVDYDGPDDPENPYNWSTGKKWTTAGLLSALTFVTPLASSIFAPGIAGVMRDFHSTDTTIASFVVSIYILGYAFGPLIIAPMSELYGRAIVYNVTNVLYVIFTVACAVSDSMGMLIGFRLLAGLMGSTPLTIGGGTVADLFVSSERGAAMAIWSIGPLLGPVIGPVAGSYLSEAKGWRWDFWLVAIIAGAVTIIMAVLQRETYAPVILERKAARLRKETGNMALRSKLATTESPRTYMWKAIIRPTKMLFLSPMVFFLSLYMAVVYGYLYLLFTTMTSVFEKRYHFSSSNVGLAYLGIGIGMFLGLGVAGVTSDRLMRKLSARNNGVTKPEFRLPAMIPAACLIPIGLFMYGWTAEKRVHWIAPIIGTGFVGMGMITTFMPVMTYLIDSYQMYAASVTAANTVMRSLLGALLPLAGPKMFAALGLGWGNSLLGFIALAMVPMPIIFWKYGERIRTSPRFQMNL